MLELLAQGASTFRSKEFSALEVTCHRNVLRTGFVWNMFHGWMGVVNVNLDLVSQRLTENAY